MIELDKKEKGISKQLIIASGLFSASIGFLSFIGWIFGMPLLATYSSNFIPMAPNTALSFMALGVSLYMQVTERKWSLRFSRIGAMVVLILSLIRFAELSININLNVDRWIFQVPSEKLGLIPVGRMALPTALNFLFASAALFLASSLKRHWSVNTLINILAALTTFVGLAFCLGYIYGAPLLYGGATIPMALNTAISFFVLGLGLVINNLSYDILERKQAAEALRKAHDGLEVQVAERTAELARTNEALHREIAVRKQAEETLRKSEEHFRILFEQASDGIFITDINGNYVDVNSSGSRMSGYSREEILQMNIRDVDLSDPDLIPLRIAELQKGNTLLFETKLRKKDGSELHVEINAKLLPYGKLQGVVRDITERKLAEEALRESEDKFRNLVENISDVFYVSDQQGKFLYCSPNFFTISGYSPQDIYGNSFIRVIAPIDRRQVVDYYLEQTAKGSLDSMIEFRFLQKDGSIIWVEQNTRIVRDSNGEIVQFRSVARNITGRKATEEALKESEERFRSLYLNAIVGIYRTTPDGKILMANPALVSMLGYTSFEELKKINLTQEGFNQSYPRELFIEPIEKYGEIREVESVWKRKDGKEIWVSESARAIRNSKGETLYYDGTIINITERKRVEKEITMLAHSLRSVNECVSITDMEDKILFVNESFLKTYGYNENELIGKNVAKVRSPNNPPELVKEILPATIRGGWQGELWNKRKDGSEFPIYLSTTIIYDKDNKPLGLIGVAKDITERKRTEETLRESEERFRRLFEESTDPILLLDQKCFFDCNSAALSILQFKSKDEIGNKTPWDLSPEFQPDGKLSSEKAVEMISTAKKNGYHRFEWVHTKKDGTNFFVEVMLTPIAFHGEEIFHVIWRDITERKRTEESLRKSEEQLELFFTQSLAGFFFMMLDEPVNWDKAEDKEKTLDYIMAHQRITKVNDAMLAQYGATREQFIGLTLADFFAHDIEHGRQVLKQLFDTGHLHVETNERRFDGTQMWVEGNYICLYDANKCITGQFGVQRDITERKLAEEALQDERRMFIGGPTVVFRWIAKEGWPVEYVSPNVLNQFGYTVEDFTNSRILYADIVHPDDLERIAEEVRKYSELGVPFFEQEYRIIRTDGEYRWLHDFTVVRKDDYGSITHFQGYVYDITDRKKTEETLRENEERLRTIIETEPECVKIVDRDGQLLEMNAAGLAMLEAESLSEVQRHTLVNFILPEYRAPFEALHKRVMSGESGILEFEVMGLMGTRRWLETHAAPMRDATGEVVKLLGVTRDITERKRAVQETISQKNRFAQLFENSPIAIALLDDQDKIVHINESFSMLFGYFLEEIKGQELNDIIVPPELKEEAESYSDQTRAGNQINKESYRKKKDGTLVYVQIVGIPVIVNDKTIGIYGMYVDLTQRKEAEEKMRLAKELAEQSDKLKSEFLAQISHEIRTPLNVIASNVEFLNEELTNKIGPQYLDCFTGINLSAERIIRTVDLVLNMSELQISGYKPVFKMVDLHSDVLKKLLFELQRAAAQKNLDLIYNCQLDETKILVDEYSITQVFANLIDNAIKYTKKGKVEILLTKDHQNRKIIEVKDTGIGMSENFLQRMFQPFVQEEHGYSRTFDGSGLGLALVKRYCEINNARIEVESKKNLGSTFRVIFRS
ncbi:MAG: PAS domain S-box protein [Bacteroidetes bacterium]|nr:PAS domain S-box protein [Bacteroidota bacterium]